MEATSWPPRVGRSALEVAEPGDPGERQMAKPAASMAAVTTMPRSRLFIPESPAAMCALVLVHQAKKLAVQVGREVDTKDPADPCVKRGRSRRSR